MDRTFKAGESEAGCSLFAFFLRWVVSGHCDFSAEVCMLSPRYSMICAGTAATGNEDPGKRGIVIVVCLMLE